MIVSGSVLNFYALSSPPDQSLLSSSVKCFEKHILCKRNVFQSAVLVSYAKKDWELEVLKFDST